MEGTWRERGGNVEGGAGLEEREGNGGDEGTHFIFSECAQCVNRLTEFQSKTASCHLSLDSLGGTGTLFGVSGTCEARFLSRCVAAPLIYRHWRIRRGFCTLCHKVPRILSRCVSTICGSRQGFLFRRVAITHTQLRVGALHPRIRRLL